MYPRELTLPMEQQLTDNGFEALTTAEEVDQFMAKKGISILVVNSVCGCAAGSARPGVLLATKNEKKPANMATVFAGVHREATDKAREYMLPYPPSSPSMAIFKDGELVHFLERHHIEGRTAEMIAEHLVKAFEHFC